MARPVSMYAGIWNKLKADKSCRVAADPKIHKRIVKAVIRRKDEDLGYKLLLENSRKKARLAYEFNGSQIIFTLKITYISLGIEDL